MDEDAWFVENFLADDDLDLAQRLIRRHDAKGRAPRRPKKRHVVRDIASGHVNIVRDYLGSNPTYNDVQFERRYLLPKALFKKIVSELTARGLMIQGADAAKRPGATSEQKMLCALRALKSGSSLDMMGDYCRMSESSARQALLDFCRGTNSVFGPHFLRWPSIDDIKRIYETNAVRGFHGLVGNLDCAHWAWRACPRAYTGQYKGKERRPTIVIEAVAGPDTRIWHAFVGTPGACNDINELDRSPLMGHLLSSVDSMHQVRYILNGKPRSSGYLLADSIYPDYAVFVKPLSATSTKQEELFNIQQAAVRKDVERTFGLLKGRFGIIGQPARWTDIDDLVSIARARVILHNIRLEFDSSPSCVTSMTFPTPAVGELHPVIEIMSNSKSMVSGQAHKQLRNDLIAHLSRRQRKVG